MRERVLFVVMVLVHLLPAWSVDHFPSMDGPAHVYNAWVLLHLHDPDQPQLGEHFEVDPRPIPNWLGHAVLALLMGLVEPRTAEKILVSGYIVLFCAGVRYLAGSVDPDRRWLAWLAFPLVYSKLLHIGFYNYCLAVCLFLFALGVWWRRRASPDLGFALKINLVLLLCYSAHLVPHVLALAAIGILWLATLQSNPWKRHLLHIPILAPQAVLPLWFVLTAAGGMEGPTWTASTLRRYLLRLEVLVQFGDFQIWIASLLAAIFLALVLFSLWQRLRQRNANAGIREEDGFLIVTCVTAILYFVGPSGVSTESVIPGGFMKMRLSLMPWLTLIPWLAPRLGRIARAAVAGLAGLLAIAHLVYLVQVYRSLQPDYAAFFRGAEAIPARSRAMPLLVDLGPHRFYLNLLSYTAIDKGLVLWPNYEAVTRHFPLRFREPYMADAERLYRDVVGNQRLVLTDRIDAVYTWRLLPGAEEDRELRDHGFRLIAARGAGRVYVRALSP